VVGVANSSLSYAQGIILRRTVIRLGTFRLSEASAAYPCNVGFVFKINTINSQISVLMENIFSIRVFWVCLKSLDSSRFYSLGSCLCASTTSYY
jgi:hypothetical protein